MAISAGSVTPILSGIRQLKSELHSSIRAFHPKSSSGSTEAGVKRKANSDATATASKLPAPAYPLSIIAEHPHSQDVGTESGATSSHILSTQQTKSPPITVSIIFRMECHMHN